MIKDREEGFTIIEVALVLAVAALIFLVVFLAVPALQRNQRDDARKRDVSNVAQAVVNAVANSNVQLANQTAYNLTPQTGQTLGAYLDSMSGNVDYVVVRTSGTSSTITQTLVSTSIGGNNSTTNNRASNFSATQCQGSVTGPAVATNANLGGACGAVAATAPAINRIMVYPGVKCVGNTGVEIASARSVAIVVQVENGGNGKFYCQNAN